MASKDTFTAEVPKEFETTDEYTKWKEAIDGSLKDYVEAAESKIENDGLITNAKKLENGLYERKWKNGLRVYFSVVIKDEQKTLLILGSGKGKEQAKAIKQCEKILEEYNVYTGEIKFNDGGNHGTSKKFE
ncbi:MAG: hypothetical protein HOE90_24600 [Bacteriovoracaceae bacterium]|jgi:putative component of toxin-antitoxin plasmid stabilization module|nr:hypothetical protein [Bacteriovoracaceae bacterium]